MTIWRPSTGTKGLDRSLSIATAAPELFAQGFRFAIRTLGLPGGSVGTLSAGEVTKVHQAGLALGAYQVIRKTGFTSAQGTTDGAFAATEAKALGFPAGSTLWFDLEGEHDVSADALASFVNHWAGAVKAAGYAPGLYNGPQSILTGAQISGLPDFHAYWQAGALVPPVARGYQIYQLLPANLTVGGVNIDVDVVQTDFKGDSPSFWLPAGAIA